MEFRKIPEILGIEHDAISAELEAAAAEGGETGAAARSLAELMHAHMIDQGEFALAQAGHAVRVEATAEVGAVIALSECLKGRLERLTAAHQAIAARLERFRLAALGERKLHYARFADLLRAQLRSEEELIYPAAILIGGYVRLSVADPAF